MSNPRQDADRVQQVMRREDVGQPDHNAEALQAMARLGHAARGNVQ
jgi:hypothetical protein